MPPKRVQPDALSTGVSKRICSAIDRDSLTSKVQPPSCSELSDMDWTDGVTWYEGSEAEDEQPSTAVAINAKSNLDKKGQYIEKKENSVQKGSKEPSSQIDVVKMWSVSFSELLGVDVCKIYVGKREVLFQVHKRALCQKVPYFKALLKESHGALRLEDDSPECFDLLLEWIYTNKLRAYVSKKTRRESKKLRYIVGSHCILHIRTKIRSRDADESHHRPAPPRRRYAEIIPWRRSHPKSIPQGCHFERTLGPSGLCRAAGCAYDAPTDSGQILHDQ